MPLGFLQPNRLRFPQLDDFAIDADSDEPFPLHLLDHIAEFALLVLEERRQQDDPGLRRVGENLIDDLLRRLPMNRLPRRRIVRLSDRWTLSETRRIAVRLIERLPTSPAGATPGPLAGQTPSFAIVMSLRQAMAEWGQNRKVPTANMASAN